MRAGITIWRGTGFAIKRHGWSAGFPTDASWKQRQNQTRQTQEIRFPALPAQRQEQRATSNV
ncbi:hypothetical protein GTA51_01900 [Desulfovibrio aerotolerans]|uniref:Uncharacterized protein n=1 Tax=Solidesulfovibrio aerotolerans TaxID=295255 RepID=A0A7C9MHI2_9BACT|nr:hypothetical protein [Solidesulfovibrio aerotolerans]MYL81889.1 hypothetical protein [Solidesulfovibrio aerotolerans]